jgi:hypothetical protein
MKKLLIKLFCKKGIHIWKYKSSAEDSWWECILCRWQIEFSKEEYDALKSLNNHIL